jgi:hypothetical protein
MKPAQSFRLPPAGGEATCCASARAACLGLSRRAFLERTGTAAALGALAWLEAWPARAVPSGVVAGTPLPFGQPLRVKPPLVYHLDQPREKTSWRSYGGLRSPADVDRECERITRELEVLSDQAAFPLQFEPLSRVNSDADARASADAEADVLLVFGASGAQHWIEQLAASGKPTILFVRRKSGPVYLWYEIAHWRLLRKSEDTKAEPNLDFDDVVVDEYVDVLWRLRALYGLKNARGTRMLALGGTEHYSRPAQELAPAHARDVWGYETVIVPPEELRPRIAKVKSEPEAVREAERLADELIAQPNVALDQQQAFLRLQLAFSTSRPAHAGPLRRTEKDEWTRLRADHAHDPLRVRLRRGDQGGVPPRPGHHLSHPESAMHEMVWFPCADRGLTELRHVSLADGYPDRGRLAGVNSGDGRFPCGRVLRRLLDRSGLCPEESGRDRMEELQSASRGLTAVHCVVTNAARTVEPRCDSGIRPCSAGPVFKIRGYRSAMDAQERDEPPRRDAVRALEMRAMWMECG